MGKKRRTGAAQGPGTQTQGGKQRLSLPQIFQLVEQHRMAGRLADAENLCRQVLQARPENLLAIVYHQAGDNNGAVELLHRAIAAKPDNALFHCNLIEVARLAGRLEEAIAAGRQAIALRPDYAEAHNNLGIAYYDRDDMDQAVACYREAIALKPSFAQAHSNLGNALRAQQQLEEAISAYDEAIKLEPRYAEAHNNRGTALRELKRLDEAEAAYRQSLALRPNNPETLGDLALALVDLERPEEALQALLRSTQINPAIAKTQVYLASVLLELERTDEARQAVQRALALAPTYPEAVVMMGRVEFDQGATEAAVEHYRQAIALNPELADAHNNLGNALKELGKLDEALASYEQALALKPGNIGTYVNLVDSKKFKNADDPHLVVMEEQLQTLDTMPTAEQYRLRFSLGKAYGDLDRFDESFEHLLEANALKRAELDYDEPLVLSVFDRIMSGFTPELVQTHAGAGDPSNVPIFVLGMPRSGTTLVEQILASHPQVFGAGELRDLSEVVGNVRTADNQEAPFPEFMSVLGPQELSGLGAAYVARLTARAPSGQAAGRITDKMPSNYYYVGLIHLILPNARIIHVRRTPAATCVSCFQRLFASELPYTYNLEELGRYYSKYAALMDHWRTVLPDDAMLEVDYETVVADIEGQARRLLDYCGLPWDDACLKFHETQRPVKTASATQVRQPIYTSALDRWRVYEPHLAPLFEALGDANSGA